MVPCQMSDAGGSGARTGQVYSKSLKLALLTHSVQKAATALLYQNTVRNSRAHSRIGTLELLRTRRAARQLDDTYSRPHKSMATQAKEQSRHISLSVRQLCFSFVVTLSVRNRYLSRRDVRKIVAVAVPVASTRNDPETNGGGGGGGGSGNR